MCKINWEERFFEVAKDHYIRYKNIGLAFLDARRFIDSYREAYEQATEEIVKEEKPKAPKNEKDDSFEEVWVAYRRKGSKKKSLDQWNKLSQKDKENVKRHIPIYVESVSEVKFQRDFERYLRDKVFNNVLYDRFGLVLFDPDVEATTQEKKSDKLIIGGVEYK